MLREPSAVLVGVLLLGVGSVALATPYPGRWCLHRRLVPVLRPLNPLLALSEWGIPVDVIIECLISLVVVAGVTTLAWAPGVALVVLLVLPVLLWPLVIDLLSRLNQNIMIKTLSKITYPGLPIVISFLICLHYFLQ